METYFLIVLIPYMSKLHVFKERISYLDGLRGLAALVVYLHHFTCAFLPALYFQDWSLLHLKIERIISRSPLFVLIDGPMVVFIFFILSGFVLTKVAYEKVNPDNLIYYLIKRYFRLAIPVLVSILLAFLLLFGGYMFNTEAARLSGSSEWLSRFYVFIPVLGKALYQGAIGSLFYNQVTYNPLLWTVYYEFLGSIIILGFVSLLKVRKILKTLITCIVIILFPSSPIISFFFGMLIYEYRYLLRKGINIITKFSILIVTYLLWDYSVNGVITRTLTSKTEFIPFSEDKFIIQSLVALGIVVFVVYSNLIQKLLNTKIFQFLGHISFSFYVIHLILISSIGSKIYLILNSKIQNNYLLVVLFTFIILTVLTILISWIFTKLIDEKGIILSNYIFRLLSKRK